MTEKIQEVPGAGGPPEYQEDLAREGMRVKARSQWELFRRRFFRHKLAMVSLTILVIITLASVFAEYVAPYGFTEVNIINRSQHPTFEDWHLFGTDRLGRDYFSRVLYGTRTSISVAFVVALLSTAVGTIIGALAGYFRGWLDTLLMRLTDFVIAVPFLAVVLVIAAFIGRGSPFRIALILSILLWTTIARIVRGNYLSLREKEFVEAARSLGASDTRIIFREILPNLVAPIIVYATLIIPQNIARCVSVTGRVRTNGPISGTLRTRSGASAAAQATEPAAFDWPIR
jgi:ABC-type dipeptide/oligopeptide/nickel transport system permease subunit